MSDEKREPHQTSFFFSIQSVPYETPPKTTEAEAASGRLSNSEKERRREVLYRSLEKSGLKNLIK